MRPWLVLVAACYHDAPAPQAVDVGDPPAPTAEAPAAKPGYVWIAGRWARSGEKWVWLDGYYERERPGFRWQQGKWIAVAPTAPSPLPVEWASKVRAVSSEYSPSDWSAQRALGPPDVYPRTGDLPNAWASQQPDAATEFIEVGYDKPQRASAVRIFETFNPGAISRIDTFTEHGSSAYAVNGSSEQPFELQIPCSADPIVAVRVTLDSASVPGWNEIDAIGLVSCP